MSKKQSEIELLLCCARAQPDSETTLLIQDLVQKDLDWNYLLQNSLQNKVMPIFYKNMKKLCPQKVPADIMSQLKKHFLSNAARSHLFANKLKIILKALEDHHITAIPFKGPVLSEIIYGDISLRQFSDLDILIYPHDVLKAHNVLVNKGCLPQLEVNAKQIETYIKNEYSFTYTIENTPIVIDLHWKLMGRHSSFPLDLNTINKSYTIASRFYEASAFGELKKKKIPIQSYYSSKLANKIVQYFSPEYLLLYQCLHSCKNTWDTLDDICSIAEIINAFPEMDWEFVETQAQKMRCERMLFTGLYMAYDLFEIPLPKNLINRVEIDFSLKKIVRNIYDNIFNKNNESRTPFGSDFSIFQMKMRDNIFERLHYIFSIVFKPSREDCRKLPMPASLSFLYYIFRPIRLVAGFGRSLLKP